MVEIDKRLYQEIKDYCKLNNLVIKDFVNKLLKKAFIIEKYGDRPFSENNITIGNDAIQKLTDSVFAKTEVNPSYYGEAETDNRVIGKMELPDEPPYNTMIVTTEPIKEIEVQDTKEIKDIVEVEPKKEEPKPQVKRKSRKRKLN